MSGVDTVGFVLGVSGWVLTAVCLANEEWKVSTLDGSVITTSTIYENLWKSCASDSTGVYNCRYFLSLFGLSNYVRASQALMIISIILGFLAGIVALLGLQCVKVGSSDPLVKGKIALAGGVTYIMAALCAMVPVSWYAFKITMQFYDLFYPGTKYEIGAGLYIGWAGSSLSLIGGILLCCSCKSANRKKGNYPVSYRLGRSVLGPASRKWGSELDDSNYNKSARGTR
uniref:Claudin n=1 Tax=Callorhinchus milii TaxID=7868 RepID=K4FU91_CALMI|nr:claudin 15a [Callorhinchus milii]